MTKKNACTKCKFLHEGEECPQCKANASTPNWKGRIFIVDTTKSEIAKKLNHNHKGEYAIKV